MAYPSKGILDHVWGVSREQDLVWAEVAGMDPERADRKLLMLWRGFFDESEKDGWFVLAGYLAKVPDWAAFAADWAPLARHYGRVDDRGRWHIHMSELANRADAAEYLPLLKDTIFQHVLAGVALAFKPSALRRALDRVVGIEKGEAVTLSGDVVENHYLFAFQVFMDHLRKDIMEAAEPLDQIDLSTDTADFFFDERHEKKVIYEAWEEFLGRRQPDPKLLLGSSPRFLDDKEFLPLQAADFFAYWFRRAIVAAEQRGDGQIRDVFPFPSHSSKPVIHRMETLSEDSIVEAFLTTNTGERNIKWYDREGIVTLPRS